MEDSGIDSGDHNGDSMSKPMQNSERLLAVCFTIALRPLN